jgi:hypothetical protein
LRPSAGVFENSVTEHVLRRNLLTPQLIKYWAGLHPNNEHHMLREGAETLHSNALARENQNQFGAPGMRIEDASGDRMTDNAGVADFREQKKSPFCPQKLARFCLVCVLRQGGKD